MALILRLPQYVQMAKKSKKPKKGGHPGHYIRQWRDAEGLTLERLAERVGLTHGTLSRIERGKTAYTQQVLEALADALGTTPASLIMRDPLNPSIYSIWDNIPVTEREQAAKVLEAFVKKAS